jgi:hypothetical protein
MKAVITHRFLPKRLLSLALGGPLGQGAQVNDVPIPSITDNEVLVKVHAVALNPIDSKTLISFPRAILPLAVTTQARLLASAKIQDSVGRLETESLALSTVACIPTSALSPST